MWARTTAITRMTDRAEPGSDAPRGAVGRPRPSHGTVRRPRGGLATFLACLVAAQAGAQTWTLEPRLTVEGTATNNVNLSPSNQRESDFVTQITPSLSILERGAHTNLTGLISLPVVIYARTGSENDQFLPSISLLGDVNFFERRVFVEGEVSVAQQFLNPFGPQPIDLANATSNRYQSNTYRVSPYIKSSTANGTQYELRNDNVWTNLSGAPVSLDNARYTQFIARAANYSSQLSWRAEANYNDTKFNEQNSIVTRLVRFEPIWVFDPAARVSASIGYEDNDYQLSSSRDVIYGVGFEWHPTPRTNVLGNWEHRFFGSSYRFSFDHRTPLTAWNVLASRNITTYPQQLATIPAGVDVPAFLNLLFASIADPIERQRAVEQLMQNRGLPSALAGPLPLYAQQILLQQQASATAGLIGARNTIFLTIFTVKSEPIAGTGQPLPPIFAAANDNTQTGAALVWTHNFAPRWLLTGSANLSRTVANAASDFKTRQGAVQATVTYNAGPNTALYSGARYQASNSDVAGSDYNETAVFVGFRYTYR